MKELSIVKDVLKKKKIVLLIAIVQIFFVFFVSTIYVNYYREFRKDLDYLIDKPIANSIAYMNKFAYRLFYGDKLVTNMDERLENNKKLEDFVKGRKDLFKGISPLVIDYYFDDGQKEYYFTKYDSYTMKNLERYIVEGKFQDYEPGKEIPALLRENLKGRYKIGDSFSLHIGEIDRIFRVTGFFSKDIKSLHVGIISNSP